MRRKAVAALLEGTRKHEKDLGVSDEKDILLDHTDPFYFFSSTSFVQFLHSFIHLFVYLIICLHTSGVCCTALTLGDVT